MTQTCEFFECMDEEFEFTSDGVLHWVSESFFPVKTKIAVDLNQYIGWELEAAKIAAWGWLTSTDRYLEAEKAKR